MLKFQRIITKIGEKGIFPPKDKLDPEAKKKKAQIDLGGVYKGCKGERRKGR